MYPKRKTKTKTARHLKSILSSLIILSAGLAGGYQANKHISPPPTVHIEGGNTQVRFSPKGGCTKLLTQAMSKAKQSLEIAIFDLTSQDITDEILRCHQKGIHVRIVADRRQSKGQHSKLAFLHQQGVPIRIAKCSGLMHHKFTIIDNGRLGMLTGSFNYSSGAENKNTENLLWIKSKTLAKVYEAEWEKLWSRGKAYMP